ncbi:MAG: ATP-binding protein [Woeseiaceae bacterium]|nr:ATP-binding protein [Woeseiaceae bacterium]
MRSLSARLLVSVSLLLIVFFGATIAVLDYAFRSAGEEAQENILDGYLMQLLAAAEPDASGGLTMPLGLPEARFDAIGSGLYAELRDDAGNRVWQSRSALGLTLPQHPAPNPGVQVFDRETLSDGTPLLTLRLAVQWEFPDGQLRPYVFEVLESLDSFNAQVAEYRRQLFTWFAALASILLVVLAILLRRMMRPLRQIEAEIGEVEQGDRTALSSEFPTELTGVARNMNLLIESERARSDRYRKTLDNLAHSLKTPLAAIRALFGDAPIDPSQRARFDEQIDRMDEIVRYQLRKPSMSASENLVLKNVDIRAEIDKLVEGLSKVYRDKAPAISVAIDDAVSFRGDSGDFLELAGNLVDNACKWCGSEVRVRLLPYSPGERGGFRLVVEDDGPGVPEEATAALTQRGTRLDEATPGHGIGLSIVKDIAESYGGGLSVGRSELGGARFELFIPAAMA